MARLLNKFEIGCDPEFVVLSATGEIVNVSALGTNGPVGYDHSGHCAELRPEQARGTFTVVKRLQKLINSPYPSLKPFTQHRWRAGAWVKTAHKNLAIGGHIHFNVTGITDGRVKALDSVTKALENLEILPKSECVTRRTATQYGKWSDFRDDTSDKHIEYRTMASWLNSPWTAFLALTLAKLAIVDSEGATQMAKADSYQFLVKFLERYKGKDVNVDRLLHRLNQDESWLQFQPDADMKTAWSKPLDGRK